MNTSCLNFSLNYVLLYCLAAVMVNEKVDDEEQMYLLCWSFWWPCGCVGARLLILPDAACPWLHWKPLDAAIRQLLAPYCPGCRQGTEQTNNNQQIHLRRWPFWWLWRCVGRILRALPDGGGPSKAHRWLVVVSAVAPLPAAGLLAVRICHPRSCAIFNPFFAGCRPHVASRLCLHLLSCHHLLAVVPRCLLIFSAMVGCCF